MHLLYRGYLLGDILRNFVYGRLVCINRKMEDFLQRFIYITSPEATLLLSAKDSTADIPSSSTTSEDFHTIIHMLNLTYNDSPIKTSAKYFWPALCFMSWWFIHSQEWIPFSRRFCSTTEPNYSSQNNLVLSTELIKYIWSFEHQPFVRSSQSCYVYFPTDKSLQFILKRAPL